ncbi:hypothetical protein [Dokdonella sp.]|uniref:hypothetical protein n=1 Tax=Dokdonella sp. TaxID=2291710 RepID=UPI002F40D92B
MTVSREATRGRNEGAVGYRYSLSGPPDRFDLAAVEARLLAILEARFPGTRISLFRLDGVPRPK